MMQRRQFIRALFSASAAAVIPAGHWLDTLASEAVPGFDPEKSYGDFFIWQAGAPLDDLVDQLVMSARRFLPKGTRFGVLVKTPEASNADPFAEVGTIAWRYPARPADRLVRIA